MKLEQETRRKFDEEIDAALQLLHEVQPPAAMMSRVRQSLEIAADKSQRVRSRGLFWIPVTGAALAVALLLAFSHGGWTMGKQSHAVETAETARMSATTPRAGGIAASWPVLAPAVSSKKQKPASQPALVRRTKRERPQYRHVANLLSYPLTRQEKLLVQFAQTASPADLQMLNPEYQAKVEAQQEAEFAAYLKSGDDYENNFGGNTTTEAAQSNQTQE